MNRLLFTLTFILAVHFLVAQSPKIAKVEPPNWWTGMKWNKVQLMVYGENLNGIAASTNEEALSIEIVHTLPNASYAFIDLVIHENLKPGIYPITITKGNFSTEINYEVMEKPDPTGKYQGFNKHDLVYLITPDRFANGDPSNDRVEGMLDEFDRTIPGKRHGGDLKGLINKLDYLEELGITCVWLNPILENSGRGSYHGYAATDLYKIDPRFGTNKDYKTFVEEAHKRGIKVIFDHVNNHIGVEHEWLANLPMDSWINGTKADHIQDKHYKYTLFDPYSDETSNALLRDFWFSDYMPDLNQRNPYLANYLIQNSIWWMAYTGLDGIREDTYPYPDQPFLADWAKAILEEFPKSNIVGEIWNPDPAACAFFQHGSFLRKNMDFDTHLPSVMDFAFCNAVRDYLEGKELLSKVYEVFAQDFLYADPDNIMTFIDNHDMPRAIFITEGANQEMKNRKLKQALTMLLTTRGIPQMLYATEINMKGGESHVKLRADFPGGWAEDQRDAFSEAGRTEEERDIFNFTQKLISIRKNNPEIIDGKFIHFSPAWSRNVYKYLKIGKEKTYMILINGHEKGRAVDLSEMENYLKGTKQFKDLVSGEVYQYAGDNKMEMEGYGLYVLELIQE